MLKKLASLLLSGTSYVFGGSCYVCKGAAREILCAPCESELPRLPRALCRRCALDSPAGSVCGRCLAQPPSYDATFAALEYAFPADALVHALKFRGELALAPFLAGLLLGRDAFALEVDCVIPVPLSARRLRERGYNQAAEIARPIAKAARVPLELSLCERSRDTAAQIELPWSERGRNVRGAFTASAAVRGACVAVVDDVMTTGATLDEISAVLKRAGATRVVNCVVARTFPPG